MPALRTTHAGERATRSPMHRIIVERAAASPNAARQSSVYIKVSRLAAVSRRVEIEPDLDIQTIWQLGWNRWQRLRAANCLNSFLVDR